MKPTNRIAFSVVTTLAIHSIGFVSLALAKTIDFISNRNHHRHPWSQ